jgi:hypothetical protein
MRFTNDIIGFLPEYWAKSVVFKCLKHKKLQKT